MMELKPVSSTNIARVGHDEETQELQIEFKDGALYAFDGVPTFVHQDLLDAESKGKYFHKHIKDQYKFKKVK